MKEALEIIAKLYYTLAGKDHLSEQDTKLLVEAYNFLQNKGMKKC